jgi:hypothetical protein
MARTGPLLFTFLAILCVTVPAVAQENDRITQLEQKLDELLRQADAIRQELNAIKGAPATELPAPTTPSEDLTAIDVTTPEATAATATPAAPASSTALNPDISVIGTFLSHAGDNFEEREPIALDEVEVALQAFIDPYAKGHFFIAITPEEVDVEEAYAQFVTLPWGLTAKAGKTKATFGKAYAWHTHTRKWADQPMMLTYFLGEEGLADVGLSVSKSIDNPFGAFIEATGEVYSGDVEGSFGRAADNDLLQRALEVLPRPRREQQHRSRHELGARNVARQRRRPQRRLAGVDVTYRWKPLARDLQLLHRARSAGERAR